MCHLHLHSILNSKLLHPAFQHILPNQLPTQPTLIPHQPGQLQTQVVPQLQFQIPQYLHQPQNLSQPFITQQQHQPPTLYNFSLGKISLNIFFTYFVAFILFV
jgi:hypothetical protein